MNPDLHMVFVLYPGVTQLDFTGPLEVLSRLPGAQCSLVSTAGGELQCDGGFWVSRVLKLSEIEGCDVLCVPGGLGTIQAMEDGELLSDIRRLAGSARYVSSVCTGSLLLGAAGLLRGKRAACHWAWREHLAAFGAEPDASRVVRDGNCFTGGGVTAGIDMALAMAAEIAGDEFAQSLQLGLEYAPQPPFQCGRPELAPPAVLARVQARLDAMREQRESAIVRAAAQMSRI
ncbi:DJ-1/PfpI family protein [Chromobacterium sp. IIBBL 290-4]|uniref:DJ-1/PfpI family protein n=1 Tax=Chromobacterium sp. IIBBL 290-4 TaxID=2953890 RepID=UPI0020B7B1C6|nr:DJ-1/PfpI family protein [Chromobacterium sp. IIBBL 290-4]UTH73778.1 DJ-1/PfpI family protein [Chromobacterium sp. IIBBL 290-4]